MGRENYAVARTDRTLIVADLKRGLVSEVSWKEPEVVQVLKKKTFGEVKSNSRQKFLFPNAGWK
jgi:hypothetical protein